MRRDSRPPGASAHRPGYAAGQYYQPGHDIAGWVAEDQRLSAAEAAAILDTDVEPAVASLGAPAPPVIIGGDFNSGSDQDAPSGLEGSPTEHLWVMVLVETSTSCGRVAACHQSAACLERRQTIRFLKRRRLHPPVSARGGQSPTAFRRLVRSAGMG